MRCYEPPTKKELVDFVIESNRIEGIVGATGLDVSATSHFIGLNRIYISDIVSLVNHLQPDAFIRVGVGSDVTVGGSYSPPRGGPAIMMVLGEILDHVDLWEQGLPNASPYKVHCDYETLHPFTDGNGRSGRALWAWQMLHAPLGTRERRVGLGLGFLHEWYYQGLRDTSAAV